MKYFILSFMLLFLGCYRNTKLMECDHQQGLFIRGTHYIPSKYVTESEQIDYIEFFQQYELKRRAIPHQECINFY